MLRARWQSFVHAFEGIKVFFAEEVHAWIHLIIALMTVGLGFLLSISKIEWIVIILCIFMVITAEIFNTSIERLCDRVTRDHDPLIKKTKDLASAAVLMLSFMSVIIGIIIFFPKIV